MLQPKIRELFGDLNRKGIIWVLLRLPSGDHRAGGDVDVFIRQEHILSATQLICSHGFVRLSGWEPDFHFIRYDDATDEWTWLHIVTKIFLGHAHPIDTKTEQACLERRIPDGDIYRLAPSDSFWELLFHCLFDKHSIALKHQVRLQELAKNHPEESPLIQHLDSSGQDNCSPDRIIKLVQNSEWDRMLEIEPQLSLLIKQNDLGWDFYDFYRRMFIQLQKLFNIFNHRGISVAILGPDGAGKSTIISELERTFILPVRVVYMGLTGGLLPYADRLRLPIFVIPARLIIFWGRYIRARYYQLRGNVVLFDRYIYDYKVPTPYKQTRLQQIIRWIDGHSCPAPDLTIVLDAPGEIMHQRKGEYTPEMLENWRQHYLALQFPGAHLERIDTTCSIPEMRMKATRIIWSFYINRWVKQNGNGK